MKRIALVLGGVLIVAFTMAQRLAMISASTSANAAAEFSWASTTHDFGQIAVDVPVSHKFTFENTGEVPLVISSVQASCGCTVTAYTKEPIAPGATGYVKATYNAAKVGQFTKTVTVNTNTSEAIVQLTIKGEVVE
jgi:hypothetical protein